MSISHVKLKHTDLEVSRFCFGTMTLGKPTDQAGTNELVDRCIEGGINFFDTANMYQCGVAETLLGNALKGRRGKVVLASKVRYKAGEEPDQPGLSRKAMLRAIDETLQRLQTDYLDLYYFHAPDHETHIDESLEVMDSLVKQGKVRYPASSNCCRMGGRRDVVAVEGTGLPASLRVAAHVQPAGARHRARVSPDVQAVRCLDRGLQPAGRRTAHRQAQAVVCDSGNALR